LTWQTASSFEPAPGDVVLFDGPIVEWDTIDSQMGLPSGQKRLLQSYAELWTTGDTPAALGILRDNARVPSRTWTTTFEASHKGLGPEGPSLGAVVTHKRWAGLLAQWARIRFVGWYPLTEWGLVLLGLTFVTQDEKRR
jgi:hypothetical protein